MDTIDCLDLLSPIKVDTNVCHIESQSLLKLLLEKKNEMPIIAEKMFGVTPAQKSILSQTLLLMLETINFLLV